MRASKLCLWLAIAIAIPLSCFVKGWLEDANNNAFIAELATARARMDALMTPDEGPRVLIAGGSNALSSYDSAAIADATGLPVYNVGVLAEGLDIRNMFGVAEARARAGDIVVVSALSVLSHRPSTPTSREAAFESGIWRQPTREVELPLPGKPLAIPALPLFSTPTLLRSAATYRQWALVKASGTSADDTAIARVRLAGVRSVELDARGDWIDCTQSSTPKPLPFDPKLVEHSQAFANYARDFASRLTARGVTVHFVLPTVLIREQDRLLWEAQIPTLLEQFGDIGFLDADRNWQLNADAHEFCDTNAHLLRRNAARNSAPIIAAVRADQVTNIRLVSK